MSDLYDRDFYAWAAEQGALLRAGKLSAADVEHIAEEIESMGRGEKRELTNRLAVLLAHLLKWQFLPVERRADLLLSTLSSYVAAMGGGLRLVAEFPNRTSVAIALADIAGEALKPNRRGRATNKPSARSQL